MRALTTPAGRQIPVLLDHDLHHGRTVYQLRGIGSFTIEPEPTDYPRRGHLRITFGRVIGTEQAHHHSVEDLPVLSDVTLCGTAAVHPDAMTGNAGRWLTARRSIGSGAAIPATDTIRRRAADIVQAIILDWLALPEHPELMQAHNRHFASRRLVEHRRTIQGIIDQIALLTERLKNERAAAACQQRLTEQPVPAP